MRPHSGHVAARTGELTAQRARVPLPRRRAYNGAVVHAMPKVGDLRVWRIVNIPNEADYFAVASVEEARALVERMIQVDLQNPNIASNVFGLEVFEDDGEWHEWHDDQGRSLDDLLREKDEE